MIKSEAVRHFKKELEKLTIQEAKLGAHLHVLALGNGVGHDNLVDGRSVDAGDGVTAENAMGQEGVDLSSAVLLEELGSPRDRVAGINKIINENAHLVLDITNQHHTGVALLAVLGGATLLWQVMSSRTSV